MIVNKKTATAEELDVEIESGGQRHLGMGKAESRKRQNS